MALNLSLMEWRKLWTLHSFGMNALSHLLIAALAEFERHSLLRMYLGNAYREVLFFLICLADQIEDPTNGMVR